MKTSVLTTSASGRCELLGARQLLRSNSAAHARRIEVVLVLGLVFALHCIAPALTLANDADPSGKRQRPNILFAFADDWGQYASLYANPDVPSVNDVISTPNIDRVAKEGVNFPNAFISAPSCTPSRAAVSTGMHFYRCGPQSSLFGYGWKADRPNPLDSLPGFVEMLGQSGYHVGRTLKTGIKFGPGAKSYNAGPGLKNFSSQLERASDVDQKKQEVLDGIRRAFHDYLSDRQQGQPLFYWFGPTNIHRKWVRSCGQKYWGINPDKLQGKMPKFLPDVPAIREDFADGLGEVLAWDAMIGVLLEELQRCGELDDTMIVLSGDHGMPGMPRGKTNLYDFGSKVPLLVRWPKQAPGDRKVTDLVSLIDLAPTFLEAAGIAPPAHMQGRSLMNLLTSTSDGRIDPRRDAVIIGRERHVDWGRPRNLPYPARALRTEDYLYIVNFQPDRWPMCSPEGLDDFDATPPPFEQLAGRTQVAYADVDASPTKAWMIHHRHEDGVRELFELGFHKRPREELYDLRNDPDQMRNVAGQTNYEQIQQHLHARLMNQLGATGDPRVIDEGDAFDYPPYAVPGLSAPVGSAAD